MSTYADATKAHLWLDGDIFRAAADTALPADIFASTLTGWSALGGIKAGFSLETSRDVTTVDIWNNTSGGPYKRLKKPPVPLFKFRAVDYSAATTLLLLAGGTATETGVGSGIWELEPGDEDTFAMILRVYDGDDSKAYYCKLAEVTNIPTEEMGSTDDVEGFDFEVGPLAPTGGGAAVRRFLSWNPLAA
jgi:hypothetical protein